MDYSLEQVSLILNGHTVTGYSDDTDALSLPNIDIANVVRGADGKMVAVSTGDKGGPLVIKLLPNSPSVSFFMNVAVAQMNGAAVKWYGIIRDSINQTNTVLFKGTLSNVPLGQTMGKGVAGTREFTIEFERITPDYLTALL